MLLHLPFTGMTPKLTAAGWVLLLFCATNAMAQEPPAPEKPAVSPFPDQVKQLVQQLGDESFQSRQMAAMRLADLGPLAREALTTGLNHTDPEVRRSCRRILAHVLEDDYQKRLAAFVEDEKGRRQHNLPGWERYRRDIGDDAGARRLFIQMQQAEAGLLASFEAPQSLGSAAAGKAFQLRFQQVATPSYMNYTQRRLAPSLGTIAALLFVAADPQFDVPKQVVNSSYWANLVRQSAFQKALNDQSTKVYANKILGQWIAQPSSPLLMQQKLMLAVQYNVAQGLQLAVSHVEDKKLNGYYRVYAVHAIGKLGGKPHAARLVKLLDDRTMCGQRFNFRLAGGAQQTQNVEIRDVALAWLIHLTGQKHKEYGMPDAQSVFRRLSRSTISTHSLGFDSIKQRDQAFKKWRQWQAENPLPAAPSLAASQKRMGPKPKSRLSIPLLYRIVGQAAAQAAAQVKPAFANAGLAQAKGAQAPPQEKPVQKPTKKNPTQKSADSLLLPRAERDLVRKLKQAGNDIQLGRYSTATQLLGEILTQEQDAIYQPTRQAPLFRSVKAAAEGMLSKLPPRGLQSYELQFGDEAQALLQQAIREADDEKLDLAADRFFYTRAGAEAAYLLGVRYLQQNRPLEGALQLQRLQSRSPLAQRFEPGLSVQLAACWSLAGQSQAAQQTLKKAQSQAPAAPNSVRVRIAGRSQPLFRAQEAPLAWLEKWIGPQSRQLDPGMWPIFRGDIARNAISAAGSPYLAAEVLTETAEDPYVQNAIEGIFRERMLKHASMLPAAHPVVTGETVVVRTATEVQAYNLKTGRLRWRAPFDDALRHLARRRTDAEKQKHSQFLLRGLKQRLWADSAFGAMSADGERVYCIEDLPFGVGGEYQRLVVTADGQRQLDVGALKDFNRLTAYDVRTGKVKWELGGSSDVQGLRQTGVFFLGPPLPLMGRLFTIAERKVTRVETTPVNGRTVNRTVVRRQALLLELQPETGEMLRQTLVHEQSANPVSQRLLGIRGLVLPQPGRLSGASPSASGGVLVCPVSQNHFVALDLSTRKLLWKFEALDRQIPQRTPFGVNNRWQKQLIQALQSDQSDGWADTSATIVAASGPGGVAAGGPVGQTGRVLLTPQDSDYLYCLNLADGALQWRRGREQGFYIGGVFNGKVLIVRRDGIGAVRLADGEDAWPDHVVALPPGSAPSGRGYLAENAYYLPLSTAEVLAIDLDNGQWLSRSRSPQGLTPGNLVRCHDAVISQSATGVFRFEPLENRRQRLAATVRQRPQDHLALIDYAETLLYEGRLAEALEHLKSLEQTSAQNGREKNETQVRAQTRLRQLMADALIESLRSDFEKYVELARDFEPPAGTPEQRIRFLKELALGFQQVGEVRAAAETYVKILTPVRNSPARKLSGKDDELLEYVDARRQVRRNCWVMARLLELRDAADEPLRKSLEHLYVQHLPTPLLRLAIAHYDLTTPLDLQLQLAAALAEEKKWLAAEELLLSALNKAEEKYHGRVIAELALLLKNAGHTADAAALYQHLEGELADVVCGDGKRGREIVAALPKYDPVRLAMQEQNPWPIVKPKVENGRFRGAGSRYAVSLLSASPVGLQAGKKFTHPPAADFAAIEQTAPPLEVIWIDAESYGRSIVGRNRYGAQRWEIKLQRPRNSSYSSSVYAYSHGRRRGHVVVMWLGGRIVAVDMLARSGQPLWVHETTATPEVPGLPARMVWRMQMPGATGQKTLQSQWVAVAAGNAFYQQGERLVAVDLLTGQTQWTIDGMEENADLLGEGTLLLVTSPQSDRVRVFSALDGEEFSLEQAAGREPLAPFNHGAALDQRLAVSGRRMLLWKEEDNQSHLTLVDPVTGAVSWRRKFPANSKTHVIDEREIGVLDPRGRLTTFRISDGRPLLQTGVEPEPNLESFVLLRNSTGYCLALNAPQPTTTRRIGFFTSTGLGDAPVSGYVYGIDAHTGKRTWAQKVENQLLKTGQPSELPVLAFINREMYSDRNLNLRSRSRTRSRFIVLDRRTGEVIQNTTPASYTYLYQIEADVKKQTLEFRMSGQGLKLTFAANAAAGKAPTKNGAAQIGAAQNGEEKNVPPRP